MTTRSRYWCEKGLLVTVEGPEGSFRTTIEKPFARIGSHPSSEVVLPGPQVAQRGLYLHATDAGVFCINLLQAGCAADEVIGWLDSNRAITLGPYKVSAQLAGGSEAVADAQPDLDAKGAVAPPFPRISVSIDGREVAERRLRRRLTVLGRGKSSTMRLMGNYVSAVHCVTYWDGDTLWVVDLLSANGTAFEGEAIEVVELPLGSSFVLGNVRLTFASMGDERKSTEAALHEDPRRLTTSAPLSSATATGERGPRPAQLADDRTPEAALKPPDPCEGNHFEEDGDELWNRITDRLIDMNRDKLRRRRWKQSLMGLVAVLVAAGSALLLWRYWGELFTKVP